MTPDTTESLISYCRDNKRVCPQPPLWNELWTRLPDKQQKGTGWEPPLPLILAAWHHASGMQKMLRLAEHIHWAESHGQREQTAAHLRNLTEDQWHHLGE